MTVINFAHPLTVEHLEQVAALAGRPVERVLEVRTQFDPEQSFVAQARELVDRVALSPQEWQTARILVNLPSLAIIAALVLAELHGRMGYFPTLIRMKAETASGGTDFGVAEIVGLQDVREVARARR